MLNQNYRLRIFCVIQAQCDKKESKTGKYFLYLKIFTSKIETEGHYESLQGVIL